MGRVILVFVLILATVLLAVTIGKYATMMASALWPGEGGVQRDEGL